MAIGEEGLSPDIHTHPGEGRVVRGSVRRSARADVHPVVATLVVGFVGWLVLVGLALALGVLVTRLVVGHALGDGDVEVARWFAARRTDTWNSMSMVGSALAETYTVAIVLVVTFVVLAWRRCWPQLGLVAVAMACEGATYAVATYFITRSRPAVPRLEDLIVSDSFPSGHAAAAVAMYGSIAIVVWSLTTSRVWRGLTLAVAVVAPIVVAVARAYRGMHNVTDVVGGALIGAGCIVVAYVAVGAGLEAAEARRSRAVSAPTWEGVSS
jgi:undecaprenyl-diphosphatase